VAEKERLLVEEMSGKLIAVGVGPGDYELCTLKAIRLIQNATLLAYTVNEKGYSFARDIVKDLINPNMRELPLFYSMVKDKNRRVEARKKAAEQVLEELRCDNNVTYISEGDPLTYSTFIHLLEALPSDVEVEICPGISAHQSAAASARLPLIKEHQQMVILSAHDISEDELLFWLQRDNTIALYKVHSCISKIVEALIKANRLSDALLIQYASTDVEKILPLQRYREIHQKLPYFSLVIVANAEKESE